MARGRRDDDLCEIALTWPGVERSTSYGTPALKVRGKFLARLREDGDSLVVPGVPPEERDMLIEAHPAVFYVTDHYRDWPMVLVRLSRARLPAGSSACCCGTGVRLRPKRW